MLNGTHSPSRISFLFLLSTSFPALPPQKENSTKKVSREHFFFSHEGSSPYISFFSQSPPVIDIHLLFSGLFVPIRRSCYSSPSFSFFSLFCSSSAQFIGPSRGTVMQISKPNTLPPSFQSMHQGDGDLPVWVLIGSRRGS